MSRSSKATCEQGRSVAGKESLSVAAHPCSSERCLHVVFRTAGSTVCRCWAGSGINALLLGTFAHERLMFDAPFMTVHFLRNAHANHSCTRQSIASPSVGPSSISENHAGHEGEPAATSVSRFAEGRGRDVPLDLNDSCAPD